MGATDLNIVVRTSPGYWRIEGPVNENNEYHGRCECVYLDESNDVFIGTWKNGWILGKGKYYIGSLKKWISGEWVHYSSYKSYWAIDLTEGSECDKRLWCAYMISKEEKLPIIVSDHYRQGTCCSLQPFASHEASLV